jgi:DNA polymerase-3 subunit epsilon
MSMNRHSKILVFDTETTGLPKNYVASVKAVHNWPRVVSLGMALQIRGKELQTYRCIVKPDGFRVPREASNIHGITHERAMDEGIPLTQALDAFEFWLNGCDVLVAHNMSFDRPVLGCEFYRMGRIPIFSPTMERICTKEATTEYVGIPNQYPWGDPYKWPTLSELHIHLFGEDFQGAHDALDDVMATLRCFNELRKRGTFVDGEFLPTQHQKR